jgi:hypothetical protein
MIENPDSKEGNLDEHPELRRRGFLTGAAAAIVSTMVGCSTSSSLVKNSRMATAYHSYAHNAYGSYLSGLRLRYISPAEVLEPHSNCCRGVRNCLPPRSLWSNMSPTLRIADEMRRRLGARLVKVNSAYRSPYYNSMIGGAAKDSYHVKNQALDLKFACSASRAASVAKQMRAEGYFKGGIGIYSRFVHVDTRGENTSWYG